MITINDNIFDPNDQSSPFYEEYHSAIQELKLLFDKNMDDKGAKHLVLTTASPLVINPTGYPEPIPSVFIPYVAKVQSKDGYTYTWRYTKSAPSYDNRGKLTYEENGFTFKERLILEMKDLDKAFFLLYKSPLCSIEKTNTCHAYVLNDRVQSIEAVAEKKSKVALQYYIYDDNSPLVLNPDKLFELCLAYDVEKATHLKKMYDYFIGLTDKGSANEFFATAQEKLESAVINKLQYGVPVQKFIDAVIKDAEWVQIKIKVLQALKDGYIKYDSLKGVVNYSIGGFDTHICSIPPNKRGDKYYIDEVVNSIIGSEEALETLNSLGLSKGGFDPKLFDPINDDVNSLSFSELKALAKWLDLKAPKTAKANEIKTLISSEYKKRGFL